MQYKKLFLIFFLLPIISQAKFHISVCTKTLSDSSGGALKVTQHCYMELFDESVPKVINAVGYFVSRGTGAGFYRDEPAIGMDSRNCKTVKEYESIAEAYNDWIKGVITTYQAAGAAYDNIKNNCCTVARNACAAMGAEFPWPSVQVNFGVGIDETATQIALFLSSRSDEK